MELTFDDALEYQQDAFNTVCDFFEGLPLVESILSTAVNTGIYRVAELGIGNQDQLDRDEVLTDPQAIQEVHWFTKVSGLAALECAAVMENGPRWQEHETTS